MTSILQSEVRNGKVFIPEINVGWLIGAFVISAFTIILSLQWQQAIQTSINNIQKKNSEHLSVEGVQYITSAVFTVVVVILIVIVYYAIRKHQNNNNTKEMVMSQKSDRNYR